MCNAAQRSQDRIRWHNKISRACDQAPAPLRCNVCNVCSFEKSVYRVAVQRLQSAQCRHGCVPPRAEGEALQVRRKCPGPPVAHPQKALPARLQAE